jgi:hypothetical protein
MARFLSRSAKSAGVVFAAVLLFVGWYSVAANYDYGALAGTYSYNGNGVSSTLLLRKDRSFHQEVMERGRREVADGSWRRIGEGGVNFSKEFLRLPGAERFIEEFGEGDGTEADSEFYGHFEKIAGVYPILKLNANPPGPTLYKKPFR